MSTSQSFLKETNPFHTNSFQNYYFGADSTIQAPESEYENKNLSLEVSKYYAPSLNLKSSIFFINPNHSMYSKSLHCSVNHGNGNEGPEDENKNVCFSKEGLSSKILEDRHCMEDAGAGVVELSDDDEEEEGENEGSSNRNATRAMNFDINEADEDCSKKKTECYELEVLSHFRTNLGAYFKVNQKKKNPWEQLPCDEEKVGAPCPAETDELCPEADFEDIDEDTFERNCKIYGKILRQVPKIASKQRHKNSKGDAKTIMEGWLMMRSLTIFPVFQMKFCRLTTRTFEFYDKKNLEQPAGFLNFDQVSASLEVKFNENKPDEEEGFSLSVFGCSTEFQFQTKTAANAENWIRSLEVIIENSNGYKQGFTKITNIRRFWEFERIPISQFIRMADTGDIILFQGKSFSAQIQRAITGSEYDHVAMILKYSNQEIVFLESTSKDGVSLCSWRNFMAHEWHNLYSKMAFRHLEHSKSKQMIEKVEGFVKSVLGNKYAINAKLLLRKISDVEEKQSSGPKRTYFCSELVAAVLKKMHVLPKKTSCTQYWPGSFSSKNKLLLENNAKYSKEYVLDFSL